MKRNLVLTVLFAVIALADASAQIRVKQNIWLRGTSVRVTNSLTENRAIEVSVVDGDGRVIIPRGADYTIRHGDGPFLFQRYASDLTIVVRVCVEVGRASSEPNPWFAWMEDELLLGNLTITEEYLATSPSEPEIKQRMETIKLFLDRNKVVGRKEMKKELDRWFAVVKKSGLRGPLECTGYRSGSYRLTTYNSRFRNRDTRIALFVRGDELSGYRINTR